MQEQGYGLIERAYSLYLTKMRISIWIEDVYNFDGLEENSFKAFVWV